MNKDMKRALARINDAAEAYNSTEVALHSKELASLIRESIAENPQAFVRELSKCLDCFDWQGTERLCSKLIDYLRRSDKPYPLVESLEILKELRSKRRFSLMLDVADILVQMGQDDVGVRRQYAQALIDNGEITAAQNVLAILEKECREKKDFAELVEVQGLVGRAGKQVYINSHFGHEPPKKVGKYLQTAISSYADVYNEDKTNIWHGVNTVALIERAKKDKLPFIDTLPNSQNIAQEIIAYVTAKKSADLWDCASAAEACLGVEDYKQSLEWIHKYTWESSGADAFEFASTLRQFEEVWQLNDEVPNHAKLLHLLREALLRQEGGRIEVENPARMAKVVDSLETGGEFEKVLGKDRYKTFQWYRSGLERALCVAQILDRSGNGLGTGFLIQGEHIHTKFSGEWLVVTNSHVVSDDEDEQRSLPASLPADGARVRFEADNPDKFYSVKEILFNSSRYDLDCTLLRLDTQVTHAKPYQIASKLPLLDKNQRVYIIGHPRGGGLSYSIDDSLLLDHEKPKVHYRTPTEGGSSGSPVFNQDWDLIALHHAGSTEMRKLNNQSGTYPANEGICFQCIRDEVRKKLG